MERQDPANVFVNFTGYSFDSHADYHVKNCRVAHLYGTDNTDCGVFGTSAPFKIAILPYNPHIKVQSIGTSTDAQGHLPINIHVTAQGN